MAITEEMKTMKVPAGTVVHICGWPVELTAETEIASAPGNLELVTRDLYLRPQTPLSAEKDA